MGIIGNFKKIFAKKKRKVKRKARFMDSDKVKQERIDIGFRKINIFMDRAIKLSAPPKKSGLSILARLKHKPKLYPNHFKTKPKVKWFFKCGDAGYQPHSTKLGFKVPVPYSR